MTEHRTSNLEDVGSNVMSAKIFKIYLIMEVNQKVNKSNQNPLLL